MCNFFLDDCSDLAEKRKRLQEHIERLAPRIRRRLRGKFGRALDRGASDIDDVLSSMRRRADLALMDDKIRARTTSELDAYLHRIADRRAIDAFAPRYPEQLDEVRAQSLAHGLMRNDSPRTEQRESVAHITAQMSEHDRAALDLWGNGHSQAEIAEITGVHIEAQRTRWRRLWQRIRPLVTRSGPQ